MERKIPLLHLKNSFQRSPSFFSTDLLPTQARPPDRRPKGSGGHGAKEPGGPGCPRHLEPPTAKGQRGGCAARLNQGVNHSFQGLGFLPTGGGAGVWIHRGRPPRLLRPGRGGESGKETGRAPETAEARASAWPFIARPALVPPDSGSPHSFKLPPAAPGRLQPNHSSLRNRGILLTWPPAQGHDDPYRPPGALPRDCCHTDASPRLGPCPSGWSLR